MNSLDAPRIRFNWGYHDAAADVELGRPRAIAQTGPQDVKTVSYAFSPYYAAGYAWGLADRRAGLYSNDSSAAWAAHVELNPDVAAAPVAFDAVEAAQHRSDVERWLVKRQQRRSA